METSSKQSFILPARRAQWLVSALSYAYGISNPSHNEVVVLATGLDQYLQELFHHLDFDGRELISYDNFRILLDILELDKNHETRGKILDTDADTDGESDQLELNFKEFHRKLVQCFIEENDQDGTLKDKKWQCDDEFVEAEVQIMPREGHSVRTVCTECFRKKPASEIFHSVLCKQGKSNDINKLGSKPNVNDGSGSETPSSSHDTQLHEENEGLRELVEDMRQALQSSDAKNLALEVTLRKHQFGKLNTSTTPDENAYKGFSKAQRPQSLGIFNRELNRLQDARNVQIEEAMRYTQELEVDLWRSRKDQETLAKTKLLLLQNQKSLTDQLEKARKVLDAGLNRVRMLENQASKVEELQFRLEEMETIMGEDERSISEDGETSNSLAKTIQENISKSMGYSTNDTGSEKRISPSGSSAHTESLSSFEERRGPGSGASDDESGWQEDGSTLSCSENGSDTVRRAKISEMQSKLDKIRKQLHDNAKEKEDAKIKYDQERTDTQAELVKKTKEIHYLQREIQQLETERVRLSLVEETVADVMTLLRKLRELHLSRRSVGKIVMETLDSCLTDNAARNNAEDQSEVDVKKFLDRLHKQFLRHNTFLDATKSTRTVSENSCQQHLMKSYFSHKAVEVSCRKTLSSSASSTSSEPIETMMRPENAMYYRGRTGSAGSMFQVKTNFYQFGGVKPGYNITTFKPIKTELGTV